MKNKLLRHLKRGFGAVEVILLLTVVAILATFAFITIDQIKKKPITYTETNTVYVKDNPDFLTVNDVNTQLKGKKYSTIHDTVKYLETKGYAIDKLKPQDNSYEFVYLQKENIFGILQNKKVIYPEANATSEITPNVWRFAANSPSSSTNQFSYYLLDSCEGIIYVSGGIDVGNNEDITAIDYSNSNYKGSVIFRTNSITTSLTIYSQYGQIHHYGSVGQVNIQRVSFDGYHEYAKAPFLKVESGKIIAKNGGFIDLVYVLRANVALIQSGGFIKEAYCVSTDEDEAKTYGYNNVSESYGGNVYIEYKSALTFEYLNNEQIEEMGNAKIDSSMSNLYFEGVLVTKENGEKQLFSLENFSKKASEGYTFKNTLVELLADVDLKLISNWKPISNFRGVFEGNNYSIRNLNITNDSVSDSIGLFENASDGAVIRNLKLVGFNINSSGINSNVGGLVGQVNDNVFIENISIDESSSLSGGNVGGIIGYCSYSNEEGYISLLNCHVSAKLAGNMVGGFISKIANLEYGFEFQAGLTTIVESSFSGEILASGGKNNWAAGLVAYITGGDYHSKIMVTNTNVLSDNNIKSTLGNVSPAIFGSTIRYHLNGFTVNGSEVDSPLELKGLQVSDTLVVAINKTLYSVTFSIKSDLNKLPEVISNKKAILASPDMKSLGINGDFDEDTDNDGLFDRNVWYEIVNVNLTEEENFEFIVSDDFQYIGVNPSKMFENVEGQLQRRVYQAGYDAVNNEYIYKFDYFRFVEVGTPEVSGWVNELELGPGEYFDDPSEFVNMEKYTISTFYLGDKNSPENPEEPPFDEEIIDLDTTDPTEPDNPTNPDEPEEEKILIYLVSQK